MGLDEQGVQYFSLLGLGKNILELQSIETTTFVFLLFLSIMK
jgi:hypothetical protein